MFSLMEAALQSRGEVLAALREELGKRFPGTSTLDEPLCGVLESGIASVDALLPGGLPRGAMSLFSGAPSSGKTSLALSFLAPCTRRGDWAAWVHTGGFSTPSAAHARVDVERLLQVRAEDSEQALRCADVLLRWRAFSLVVLDWTGKGGRGGDWNRICRLAAGSEQAFLVLAAPPDPGAPLRFCASLHLELGRGGGEPEGCGSSVSLQVGKNRYGALGSSLRLRFAGMPQAPFPLLAELPGLGQAWHDEPA